LLTTSKPKRLTDEITSVAIATQGSSSSVGGGFGIDPEWDIRTPTNASDMSVSRPPSPCHNNNFRPPVYVIDKIYLDKVFLWRDSDFPAHLHLNFTLTDSVNNYTLLCRWAISYWDSHDDDYWFGDVCELEGSDGLVSD
jgi:hypothetical protein